MIHFATCERGRALKYLNGFRSREVLDTPDDAGPVLDLVEADIIRIPDPEFHPKGGVRPGNKWDNSRRAEITKTLSDWMSK